MSDCKDTKAKTFGPMLAELPVVSVLMITYNHEQFIRRAIESVFAQDFDGPMELVIGEDCSTDNTRAIIEDVCKSAPIHVRLLASERNVGMHANGARTLGACRGEYLALIEGDDYWTDPEKLKIQAGLLEGSTDIVMSFHRAKIIDNRSDQPIQDKQGFQGVIPQTDPRVVTFRTLASNCSVHTATVLYRRSALPELPDWISRLPWGDWAMYLLIADKGEIKFIPRTMSEYRIHAGGATQTWNELSTTMGASLMFEMLAQQTADENSRLSEALCVKNLFRLAQLAEEQGDLKLALRTAIRVLKLRSNLGDDSKRALRFIIGATLRRIGVLKRRSNLVEGASDSWTRF